MKKILTLILAATSLSAQASPISAQTYSEAFKDYHACFILYNVNEHKIVSEYNPNNYCNQRIAPDSTFKITLSLMAFNEGMINQNTTFKWDGKTYDLPDWNQDQTPNRWLKYSVLWVSQQISPQLGMSRIKHYLAGFHYGNQDFTGDPGMNNGLTYAWLSSSLKISAMEQLQFLKALLSNELPVSKEAAAYTKENMYLDTLEHGAKYYGKTGSGRNGRNERLDNPSKLRDGWFVGFVENGSQHYIFVSNLTDKKPLPVEGSAPLLPYGSQILKPITMKLLNEYFDK